MKFRPAEKQNGADLHSFLTLVTNVAFTELTSSGTFTEIIFIMSPHTIYKFKAVNLQLICRNVFRDNAIHYKSFDKTVRNTKSTWSKLIYYPFLIMNEIFEPIVIKKANYFVSLNFGHFQLLDILSFLGEAMNLNFFFKAYMTFETKEFIWMVQLPWQIESHITFPTWSALH